MTLALTRDEGARDWLAYGALLAVGGVLYVLCRLFPADLPFWMPWEFSWPVFLATTLTLAWFFRGLSAPARRPSARRCGAMRRFVLGVLADYAVLQTHVDYLAQHMFFVHRCGAFRAASCRARS